MVGKPRGLMSWRVTSKPSPNPHDLRIEVRKEVHKPQGSPRTVYAVRREDRTNFNVYNPEGDLAAVRVIGIYYDLKSAIKLFKCVAVMVDGELESSTFERVDEAKEGRPLIRFFDYDEAEIIKLSISVEELY